MARRYSKIKFSDVATVSRQTASGIQRHLPAILRKNYTKAASAARRRAAHLSQLATKAATPKLKAKYISQADEATKIAEEMERRSETVEPDSNHFSARSIDADPIKPIAFPSA